MKTEGGLPSVFDVAIWKSVNSCPARLGIPGFPIFEGWLPPRDAVEQRYRPGLTRAESCHPLGAMLVITTALMAEAQPLRSMLELKAVSGRPFPVFCDRSYALVVTGSGAQCAAAATAWGLGHFSDVDWAVNLGFAGGDSGSFDLHQWHLVNSIRDQSTGRLHVPDLMWDFRMPQTPLLTVGKPAETDIGGGALIDMEGSGFFEAARHFLPPDRIVVFKWISDNLSTRIDRRATGEAFAHSLSQIEPVLRKLANHAKSAPIEGQEELEAVLSRIRLTSTQIEYLRKWLRGYLRRGGDGESLLAVLPAAAPSTKAANKQLFEELKHVLKG